MGKNKKTGRLKADSVPFFQLTARQKIGWIAAVCFAMGWAFLLGVLVGRDNAPVKFDIDKLKNEIADLREKVVKKDQGVLYDQIEKLSNEEGVFDFHDTLKKKNVSYKLDVKKKAKEVVADTPAGLDEKDVIPLKTRASDLKQKDEITKDHTVEVTKPEVVSQLKPKPVPDTSIKKHTIQVASLKNPKDADALVLKLKNLGFPAYRVVGKISETSIWYRVRVGAFSNEAESRIMLNKVKKLYKGAMLVSR